MTQTEAAALVPARDVIPGVESFILKPPCLDVALRISISRPVAPVLGGSGDGRCAVIYATDGDYSFGSVLDTARIASYSGEIVPAVVVGIGYADETGDLSFTSTRRFLDFYRGPRRTFDAREYGSFEFGGADDFLSAIRDHVIPAVEQLMPQIDPARRVLLGTSAGGHFATYALATAPGLFQGYAIMSPMLVDPQSPADGVMPRPEGDGSMVRLIADLPEGTLVPGTRVFLSAGSREEDPGTMFAAMAVISNSYRLRGELARHGAVTEFVQFADETHTSVGGAAMSRALRFLLTAKSE